MYFALYFHHFNRLKNSLLYYMYTKMVRVCYLCGYNSKRRHPNAGNESPRSMHRIPKRKEIRVQWLNVCGLTEEIADKYSAIHICSSHFTPEDYIESNTKPKTLKPATKPSLNLSPDNSKKDFGLAKSRVSREGLKSIKTFALILQEYKNKNRFLQEMFNCSNELDTYKCLKCDYQTLFKVNLARHICSNNQHNSTDLVKTYDCKNCVFQTSSCLMLGKHIYRDCKIVIYNWDRIVSESYENNDESEENIDYFKKEIVEMGDENETIEIEWYCRHCFFKTKLKADLRKHIDQEHLSSEKSNILNKSNNDTRTTNEIKWFKCKNCTFQSKVSSNLKRHTLSKHTTVEKIEWFECENCPFKSKLKGDLKRHIIFKHTAAEKMKWLKCNDCPFQTKQNSYLKRHILLKHTAPEKIEWFKCENCSFQSKMKSYLDRHILSKHTDAEKVEWFKCKDCPFQAKHKGNLNQHIVSKHTPSEQIEWFKCENCPYKCKQKSQLNTHILYKHTEPEKIKWFKCEHCSFQSKQNITLKKHYAKKHAFLI